MRTNKKQYIIAAIILLLALSFGVALGAVTWILQQTPDITDYKGAFETTRIYSADGELLTRLYKENRIYAPLDEIPRELQEAFIAIEDTNFYVHHGIDFWGIARALVTNTLQGRRAQGASTITQQLARNALGLSSDKTYYRKIQEAYLALQFERLYTKPEILEMYLNEIFMGHSAYGVETASQQYFDKSVKELNLSESALLAGLTRAPNYYSPLRNQENALKRRNVVLNRMLELGYIDEEEAESAKNQEITFRSSQPDEEDNFPYFIRYVRDELIENFGAQMVYRGGLKVYTTLDENMQKKAKTSVEKALEEKYIPTVERENTADKEQPQMAIVTLEPDSGAIRTLIGGRGNDQYNRVTQSIRQPGSAFKPFVYATAIKNNYSPASVINDMPMKANPRKSPNKSIWPTNFGNEYRGFVSLRTGLTHSINIAAVKLMQKVGIDSTINTATEMGISTFQEADGLDDHLSLALGGLNKGVKPLEMASAYGVFANQGIKTEPFAITKILDKDDNVIYEHHTKKDIVFSEQTSYLVTDMLKSVISDGTGRRADLDRPVAGKTGTTNSYTDAWFVGYTPDLVTAVWIGEDNLQEMVYDQRDENGNYLFPEGGGPRTISSSEAARLWGEYMREVVKDREVKSFAMPDGIVEREIDPVTGLLPNEYTPQLKKEVFREENIPKETETLHGPVETVKIDKESGQLATANCPEENIEERDYIVDSGIRVGPLQIDFREQDTSKNSSNLVRGTYIIDKGEPVQKIDQELGIPETDSNGEVEYELKPEEKCELHKAEEKRSIFEGVRDFFNNDED